MKKIILLLILCIPALSYAGTGSPFKDYFDRQTASKKRSLKQELSLPVLHPNSLESHQLKNKELLKKTEAPTSKDQKFLMVSPGPQKAPSVSGKQTKDQLDSIVFVDNLGKKLNKMESYYNEKFWQVRQINSMWDDFSGKYIPVEEYILDWDEEGYLKAYTTLNPEWNEGVKIEYTYNAQHLGDSETVSMLINGHWEYGLKNTYKYDSRGNITELLIFVYEESTWVNQEKEVAAYNTESRQTLWANYYWNGNAWIGQDKEEYEWVPGKELLTMRIFYQWDEPSADWVYDSKLEQTFANDKITLQQFTFWNSEKSDWSGEIPTGYGDLLINSKTDYTYDSQGRQTGEIFSKFINAAWVPCYEYEYIWSVADNGEMAFHRKGYAYESGSKNHEQNLVVRFSSYYQDPSLEKFTYRKETHKTGDVWQDLFEEEYAYDNAGRTLEETCWTFEDNLKLADISQKSTYDNNGNESEIKIYIRKEDTETDWILSTTIKYEYENNIPVRRYQYRDEAMIPSGGAGVDFDFNVPASDLITLIGYTDPYKILYLYEYYEGDATNFTEWKRIFYYSEKEITGIRNVAKNNTLTVYPNPATDRISVNSPDEAVRVTVYNANGMKLLQTFDKHINVSSLTPGIYMIDVNGVKSKFIKK